MRTWLIACVAFSCAAAAFADTPGRGARPARPLEIASKDSLATAGDFVHTELTPAGQNIASNLYSLLAEPDTPARRAACAALAAKAAAFDPDKLANRETIALGWLLSKMSEDPAARKFSGHLEEAYWDYFARENPFEVGARRRDHEAGGA